MRSSTLSCYDVKQMEPQTLHVKMFENVKLSKKISIVRRVLTSVEIFHDELFLLFWYHRSQE